VRLSLDRILAAAAAPYQRVYPALSVSGPADARNADVTDQIRAFSVSSVSSFAPYLDSTFHLAIESRLKSVAPAKWFIARFKGQIVGIGEPPTEADHERTSRRRKTAAAWSLCSQFTPSRPREPNQLRTKVVYPIDSLLCE
jgi:hypothetical protein